MLIARALLPLALPWLIAATSPSPGASIEVAVTNIASAKGRVHVDICTQAQFVTSDCSWSGEAPAVAGTTIVTVRGVPPGRYGAQAFHDRNSNGRVDRGLFGIPREPVGFSNDAPIRMSPPRFAEAAFDHGAAAQRISVRLRSFL